MEWNVEWNGFGGKINHNETIEEAANRYSSSVVGNDC